MSLWLGIDCGGTNTKVLLGEREGGELVLRSRERFPTPRHPEALVEVGHRVRSFLDGQVPVGFGIAVPGIIDASGTVLTSTNLPWLEGATPAMALAEAVGAPGVVLHDGAAAAQAEVTLGAARGEPDAFIIALGTGVAGAHVVDGRIRRGSHGGAGEIGHVSLGGDRLCSCGQRGCLETAIGGRQLARQWQETLGVADRTAKDLVEAVRAGDLRARGLLEAGTSALARGVLAMVALLDPGIIVIGGGLATAADLVIAPTAEKVAGLATFHQVPPIVPAALGSWAAAWGALLAARASA